MPLPLSRRHVLSALCVAAISDGGPLAAQTSQFTFPRWVETFRQRALARGVSDATYTRVIGAIKPDTSVYALDSSQPEFREQVWQYLNRRVSDWRIMVGRERAREYASVLERIERDLRRGPVHDAGTVGHGVGLRRRGRQSQAHAAGYSGAGRARLGGAATAPYWEQELLNALVIIERGWGARRYGRLVGRRHGAYAMDARGWLNMGVDFNRDGRVSPFGPPDDALAGTAQLHPTPRQISPRRSLGLRGPSAGWRRRPIDRHGPHRSWEQRGVTQARRQTVSAPS